MKKTQQIRHKARPEKAKAKPQKRKPTIDQSEIASRFCAAPDDALFTREEIAAVLRCSVSKLDRAAWLGIGIKFVRNGGRCLYPKKNVTASLQTSGGAHE